MRSKFVSFVLAAAVPCACGPLVVRDQTSPLFNPLEYGTQASRGDVPVLVLGSADGLTGAALTDAVVARMQGSDWPPHARFAAATPPAATPGSVDRMLYSIVMLFNGPDNVTSAVLCARRSAPPVISAASQDGGGTTLVAGLCRYDVAVSGITARAPAISGANDPMLRDLIVSAMLELTRPRERGFGTSSDGKDR